MSVPLLFARFRRALRKPPKVIVQRVLLELRHELDRFTQPRFGRRFTGRDLLRRTGDADIDALWRRLSERPGKIFPAHLEPAAYEAVCPGDVRRILAAADRAVAHRVSLLGSECVELGVKIDWCRDFRTGDRWPGGYFRSIDYVNRGRPSDVKTAWELSRLQWLLPCGQAFALTGDEKYADATRDVLEQWMDANPYACSVNWGVTMEPAMRVFTLTWLLRSCGRSRSWANPVFRERFLCCLYLHAVFTERYLERSDVNGNHFTADVAALVVAGALFGHGPEPQRWLTTSIVELEKEIRRQVFPDGVDFEASTAYHRLVAELFLFASLEAESVGVVTSIGYRQRLAGMARFTAAYMRPDATAPLWGDHDDARTLPMGPQPIRDHRYLVGLVALHLRDAELSTLAGGSRAEAAWCFGIEAAATLPVSGREPGSMAFRDGGVYILRGQGDHVFIDCGPLGLEGRGGHGHNDLLSFEAVLDHVQVVTEGGCFVYTADFDSRNRDRSARSHNVPMIDGEEPNRFVGPEFLWILYDDAKAGPVEFAVTGGRAHFAGSHGGYQRLPEGVAVSRSISVDHAKHSLTVTDGFSGSGDHVVEVRMHLARGAVLSKCADGQVLVEISGRHFVLRWPRATWSLECEQGREAPRYGVAHEVPRLVWRRSGPLLPLEVVISLCGSGGCA